METGSVWVLSEFIYNSALTRAFNSLFTVFGEVIMDEYAEKLREILGTTVSINVSGENWVINISPKDVALPHRRNKLIGIKLQNNALIISLPTNGIGLCGVALGDVLFGVRFMESKSYMLPKTNRFIEAAEIAPYIKKWVDTYAKSMGANATSS